MYKRCVLYLSRRSGARTGYTSTGHKYKRFATTTHLHYKYKYKHTCRRALGRRRYKFKYN
jgi:hypothetical protein